MSLHEQQNENTSFGGEIDFSSFGQIVGTDITYEELDKQMEDFVTNITEPQERPECHFGFPMIKNSMPLADIQCTIVEAINNIKKDYQELLLQDKKTHDEEELENGFARPIIHEHPIESLEINNVNSFHWVLNIVHSTPEPLKLYKGDDRLHVKIVITIFRRKESDSFEGYFIYINRLKGRSPVYRDFYNTLTEKLNKKEKDLLI